MMKTWICALLALSIGTAAQGARVEYSQKPDVDFAAYRTFAWAERPAVEAEHPLAEGSALDRLIRQTVEGILVERGLEPAPRGEADLEIQYLGFSRDVTAIEGARYTAGRFSWVGVPDAHSVRSHQEGTLVIEVLDTERREIVWSGWATDVAESTQKLQSKAAGAARRILRHYPSR